MEWSGGSRARPLSLPDQQGKATPPPPRCARSRGGMTKAGCWPLVRRRRLYARIIQLMQHAYISIYWRLIFSLVTGPLRSSCYTATTLRSK